MAISDPTADPTADLRVALVGANADRGWAREAHVPAIRSLAGLELYAVATRNADSASAAAQAFGAPRAYSSMADVLDDPEVDVVAVAAAVPAHHDWILGALAAGKHVLTEWPVGVDLAETRTVAAAERSASRVVVGLQARTNPASVRARELVEHGEIGRVLAASVYSTTAGFGPVVPAAELALEDPATGMHLTTIQAAHTLDLALCLTGPLASMTSTLTTQYPELHLDDGRTGRRTLPDHVLVQGRLESGGALSAEIVGGRPGDDTPFCLQLIGERGTLRLRGGAPRGFQSGVLELSIDGKAVFVEAGELAGLPDPVVNVAGAYAALRDDLRHGGSSAPGMGDALALAGLVDQILTSGH